MSSKILPSALLQTRRHDVYPFVDPRHALVNAATGKTILVTGAGTGIGRAIAEAFALAGASAVILAARRREPLEATKQSITALAPSCRVHLAPSTDIATEASVTKLFAGLPAVPDVVVSSAGVTSPAATIADSDPATWGRDWDINLRGSYLVAREFLRAVRASERKRGGIIVNVSSAAALVYREGRSSYGGSKLALNRLSEHIDLEEQREGGTGVRSVTMHPGSVLTDMATPELIAKAGNIVFDTAQLAGGVAVYLSTERAQFLSGRYVSGNWDMEEVEHMQDLVTSEDLWKIGMLGLP